jgi:hypothetical protein
MMGPQIDFTGSSLVKGHNIPKKDEILTKETSRNDCEIRSINIGG